MLILFCQLQREQHDKIEPLAAGSPRNDPFQTPMTTPVRERATTIGHLSAQLPPETWNPTTQIDISSSGYHAGSDSVYGDRSSSIGSLGYLNASQPESAILKLRTLQEESSPLYGYNFTKEVLSIVLQPSKPPNKPYSSQVVQHLLEKKTVSTGMIEDGLLAVLQLRNDWVCYVTPGSFSC